MIINVNVVGWVVMGIASVIKKAGAKMLVSQMNVGRTPKAMYHTLRL